MFRPLTAHYQWYEGTDFTRPLPNENKFYMDLRPSTSGTYCFRVEYEHKEGNFFATLKSPAIVKVESKSRGCTKHYYIFTVVFSSHIICTLNNYCFNYL